MNWLSRTEIDAVVNEKLQGRRRERIVLNPQRKGLEIHKEALKALALVIFYMTP